MKRTMPPAHTTAAAASAFDLTRELYPSINGASVEERLMWLCARATCADGELVEIARLGAALDATGWARLIALARENGIENLLFTHVSEAGLLPHIPQRLVEAMRQHYGEVVIATRRLEAQLTRLIPLLRQRGQSIIVVKGISLARRLYGDVTLRPISDIDIIVHPEGASASGIAVRAGGFTPVEGKSQPLSGHVLRFREMQFQNDAGQTIEIHMNICRYPSYQRAFPAREIWRRALPLDGGDGVALRLAPWDELCFLCMHYAVQHQIGRLIWLTDIAELARQTPALGSWDDLIDDVIARGFAAPVAVTLARAKIWLDAPIPDAALDRLREAALRRSERRAWSSAMRPMSGARWYISQLRAVQTARERATLLWNGGAALARRLRPGRP